MIYFELMSDENPWEPQDPDSERPEGGTQVVTEEKVELKPPPLYRIILINDDYTPMDFVVWLIEAVFHKPKQESIRLMLKVHHDGSAVCGIYPYDVARTKVYHAKSLAQKHEHPLECVMETDEEGKQ